MSIVDQYSYNLVSCDTGSYPTILSLCHAVTPSPFEGQIVYIEGQAEGETYLVDPLGLNSVVCNGALPNLIASNLSSCADTNIDKIFLLHNCNNRKENRTVLLSTAYVADGSVVLNFVGECTCWVVAQLISTYAETPTVANSYTSCEECIGALNLALCLTEERTIGYAIKAGLPKAEPPDRGFDECCYSNLVLADLSDISPYKNDFSSVFFQKTTPNDTVTFQLFGASLGTINLADGTHGTLYPFNAANTNPNLTYFKVEWRKILALFGEDIFTIRMNISIAGIAAVQVDTNSFDLKPFSQRKADHTSRIDCIMDGTMEKLGVNFKDSGYETSLRVVGFFGDAKDNLEQDNLVFGSKKGVSYFESQITMNNDPEFTFQANNIPECISRELRKFIYFANQIFISDYNLNNHSYEYELYPVVLDGVTNVYPVKGRGINIEVIFKNRSKNDRKTNC